MRLRVAISLIVLSVLLIVSSGSVLAEGTHTYVVQPGDTLDTIAIKNGMQWQDLATLNNIQPPYNIFIGQVLFLSIGPAPTTSYYSVMPGDALDTIAQKFGIKWEDLAALNGIQPPYNIFIGQVLTVPGSNIGGISWSNNQNNLNLGSPYIVQPGDTLAAIGARYGLDWRSLAMLNGISNPNIIYPGQVIYLQTTVNIGYPPPPAGYHVVQSGETLACIGLKYGVNWLDLAAINKIPPPYTIYPGQQISLYGYSVTQIGSSYGTHTVQPGESLYSIGLRYNKNWIDIAGLNQIAPPYIIYPGQVLVLPVYSIGG